MRVRAGLGCSIAAARASADSDTIDELRSALPLFNYTHLFRGAAHRRVGVVRRNSGVAGSPPQVPPEAPAGGEKNLGLFLVI